MQAFESEEQPELFYPTIPSLPKEICRVPFHPEQLIQYFDGWEFYEAFNRYVDDSEERNVLWFDTTEYHINASVLKLPATLEAFMEDCRNNRIDLRPQKWLLK
jgi:hypothetical protein